MKSPNVTRTCPQQTFIGAVSFARHPIVKLALKALAAVACAYVGYYNPVRGLALLAAAFIVWNVIAPTITICLAQMLGLTNRRPTRQLVRDQQLDLSQKCLSLSATARKLEATNLMGVQDCRTHKYIQSETLGKGICYTGTDEEGQLFYAFQFFLRVKGEESDQTFFEIAYQDKDGEWRAYSQGKSGKPEFLALSNDGPINDNIDLLGPEGRLASGHSIQSQDGVRTLSLNPLPARQEELV